MVCKDARAQAELRARALLEQMDDAALNVITKLLEDAVKKHPREKRAPVMLVEPTKR